MKLAAFFLLATIFVGALSRLDDSKVVLLTGENYIDQTAGKAVFIKFYAPWCEHCKEMEKAWERLAEDWVGSERGLVAEVDCTQESDLCEEFDVDGYPTLYYGDPSSPESYDGDRDYESLSEFASDILNKKMCSAFRTANCNDEERAIVDAFLSRSGEELSIMVRNVEARAAELEETFSDNVKRLQEEYEKIVRVHNEQVDVLKGESHYKFLRAALYRKENEARFGDEF